MSDGDAGSGNPSRVTAGRIAQVLGVLLFGVGVALLVLPYNTSIAIDAPPGGRFDLSRLATEGRCEAPILDVRHGEPELWINYTPEDGTRVGHDDELLSGSWCTPESLQRGGAGALLILAALGTAVLGTLSTRRRQEAEASPDEASPDAEVSPEPP